MTDMPVGWISIAAFLVGLAVRLVKTDGMKIALANLGLPPIPTRALPWIALVLGGIAAVLDARVGGDSWEAAAKAGVIAASLAVFGHELGSGVPGMKKLLTVALMLGAMSTLTGCAWLQKHGPSIVEIFADKSKCALQNMNLPNEEIIKRCLLTPEDIPRIIPLLGTARMEAAKEAADARNDERAKLGAAACGDAGAR
jgi:hypothetical protein